MKRFIIYGVIVVILVACASTGTFFLTRHYTFKSAYNKGKSVGYKAGKTDVYTKGVKSSQDLIQFDNAYQKSIEQQRAQNSQPSQPIQIQNSFPTHCSTTTYGINNQFKDTNCY